MGCFGGLARFLLFTFNIICFLAGLAMLIVGIVYQVGFSEYLEHMEELYSVVSLTPILLIVVGAIIFVIAFLGCCGAVRKSYCMLTTYAIILIIILILQIVFVVYILLQARDGSGLQENFEKALESLFNTGGNVATETFDLIQSNLKCCGLNSFADWPTIPASCCEADSLVSGACFVPFPNGCLQVFYDFIRTSINVIGIVAGVLAGVELVGAVMALCIANTSRKG